MDKAHPNPAHHALADLERRVPDFTLVTQNVDGLHQEAGSRNVVELHGNIRRTRCSAEGLPVEPEDAAVIPPLCPNCGAMLRPDVVWFGETLPTEQLEAASEAARGCDLLLSVGTSGLVYPAAALPYEALRAGATVAEINPGQTPLTPHAHHALDAKAAGALTALLRAAFPA